MQLGVGPFSGYRSMSGTQAVAHYTFTGLAGAFFVLPAIFGRQSEGWIRALLRLPVLVGIGLVSFGLYLYHLPVWELMNEWRTDSRAVSPFVVVGIVLGLTLTAAVLSYVIIERPLIFWSTGRAAPKITSFQVDILHAIGDVSDAPGELDEPSTKVSSGHGTIRARHRRDRGCRPAHPACYVSTPAAPATQIVDSYAWRGVSSTVWDNFHRPDQRGLGSANSDRSGKSSRGTGRFTAATRLPQPVRR